MNLLLDSRILQVLFLVAFLVSGVGYLDFSIRPSSIFWVSGIGLISQSLYNYLFKLDKKSLLSAAITSLGVLLLCRARSDLYLCLAVFLGISSKFIFKTGRKHFFNPANFGIVILVLLGFPVWTSPAQWGESAVLLFWIAALGLTVVGHANRYEISFYFLATYSSLLMLRVLYLGQPYSVLMHQLQSGSLLLFTFFMISDPRSIPDHHTGIIFLAISVAVLTYVMRFYFYLPNAMLYALFFLSPSTIVIDTVFSHSRYEWHRKKLWTHS